MTARVSRDPRSIIYLANSEKIGGGNKVLMDLITGLDRRRFTPVLISPRRGALTDWASSAGVPWHEIPVDTDNGRAALVRQAVSLAFLAWRRRAGVLHAIAPRCYRTAGLAGAMTGVKRVCHVQFSASAGELTWSFRFGVDAVVTCYEAQAREVVAALPPPAPRVLAIPNSVDIHRYTPGLGDPGVRQYWRRGADQIVVTVGHLSEVKGYPTFLKAAAMIAQVMPRCRFLAVGGETLEPGYGDMLKRMAAGLGIADRVDFLGWRNDVPDILRAADVMVLPSLAEGLPLAVLEAMACGRPVVATAVNGTPEAVADGETGLLIPANAPAALADSVVSLLRDPERAERMGAAGRARVEAGYTLRRFVERTEDLYESLMAEGSTATRQESRAA